MLKVDLHTHSLRSGHALNTVDELAREARKKKMYLLGIVEHGPSMEGAPHEGYFWISDKLNELYGVEILLGVEANIINKNGKIDISNHFLVKQKVVMAGIHTKTPYVNSLEDHTLSLINAMKNPFVKIISHPFRKDFKVNVEKIVETACLTNTLLELNNQVFKEESGNQHFLESYRKMISLCKKHGHPLIIGSDAHLAKEIGEDKSVMAVKNIIGLTDNILINNKEEELKLFLRNDKKHSSFKFW